MKAVNSILFIAIIILLMVNNGCKKDVSGGNLTYTNPSPPPPPPPPPQAAPNTAPNCYTGQDKFIFLPTSFCTLNGNVHDSENNIRTILWSKVSGPSSFLIEHPELLSTKVSNLQIGIYQFELTVTDSMGMYGKDTINVTVSEMQSNTNEMILQNQTWIFPWYSSIEVKDFYSLIPSDAVFRIFIRRDTDPDWIEAYPISANIANASYEYFIEARPDGAGIYTYGSLYIFYYGMNTSDTPDVKIVF